MDVSDLWDGCLYRTGIEKNSACTDFVEGLFLYIPLGDTPNWIVELY